MPRQTGSGAAEFRVATNGYSITCVPDGLPALCDEYKKHALVCDEFDIAARDLCCVAVRRQEEAWPFLVVAQTFEPVGAGFEPGVLLVYDRLFVGAGERIICYNLSAPERLWVDSADTGFLGWSVHDGVVLLTAELEFAAWTSEGQKLWTTFVEPPWDFRVVGATVELDVMGSKSAFGLREGPA